MTKPLPLLLLSRGGKIYGRRIGRGIRGREVGLTCWRAPRMVPPTRAILIRRLSCMKPLSGEIDGQARTLVEPNDAPP
jgi:hypothetical protein